MVMLQMLHFPATSSIRFLQNDFRSDAFVGEKFPAGRRAARDRPRTKLFRTPDLMAATALSALGIMPLSITPDFLSPSQPQCLQVRNDGSRAALAGAADRHYMK